MVTYQEPTPSVPLNARSSCTESMATSNLTWAQPWTKTMLKNYAQNDPTALTLDNAYYRNLQKGFGPKNSGLCQFNGQRSRCVLQSLITAMIKLGTIRVKTGNEGEITQDCGSSNR